MKFFIATRKGNEVTVQFHFYTERASAVEGATAYAQRNRIDPVNVIVVSADTDVHAKIVAETNFSRR